jgi:hypothetical protein
MTSGKRRWLSIHASAGSVEIANPPAPVEGTLPILSRALCCFREALRPFLIGKCGYSGHAFEIRLKEIEPTRDRIVGVRQMYDHRSTGPRRGLFTGLTIVSLLTATAAHAQVVGFGRLTAPMYGGSGISTRPASPVRPPEGTFAPNHMTPDRKLCISVHPLTRPQIINPKIIDQIVIVQNICGQSIKVQVCYAGSSDCIVVQVAGYQKLQRILGIAAGSTSFRYEYRELY